MMPRGGISHSTVTAEAIHNYPVWIHNTDVIPLPNIEQSHYAHFSMWVKTPSGRCRTRFKTGWVTGIGGAQSVWVDGTLRHIKNLRLVIGSSTWTSCKSNSDMSSNSERIIILGPTVPAWDTESLTDDDTAEVTVRPMMRKPHATT